MRSHEVDSAELFSNEDMALLETVIGDDQWSEPMTVDEFMKWVKDE